MGNKKDHSQKEVGLPPRPFLYTVDQVASLLNVEKRSVRSSYIFYEGRHVGKQPLDKLKAINIAAPDDRPDWRIPERELIRWMKRKGLRYHERSWFV